MSQNQRRESDPYERLAAGGKFAAAPPTDPVPGEPRRVGWSWGWVVVPLVLAALLLASTAARWAQRPIPALPPSEVRE